MEQQGKAGSTIRIPFFDLKPQYASLEAGIRSALEEIFETQQYILGPHVDRLEQVIAQYCQARFAIGVASGSDALLLSLMALSIGPGDEVILPSFTFFATAGAVFRIGAKPVFVDIDPETYNIDTAHIENRISPRTRAIIPVHLFGQCADMDPILRLAKSRGLYVIEDAAQALGAEYRLEGNGGCRKAGQMGDLGCFSFFPTKNLGAFGDAGMVITDHPALAEKIRMLRVHGSQTKYFHKAIGINSRLDTIQAAILLVKFGHLKAWSSARQRLATRYGEQLADLPLAVPGFRLPLIRDENRHIFHQYVIRVPERDRLRSYLAKEGVGTEVYYPVPLHLQECFAFLNYGRGDLPVSEEASEKVLALPIYPELTEDQQGYVIDRLRNFYEKAL
jgi:dTDP-4-amino-4,6-dideoxygalactose transaminase